MAKRHKTRKLPTHPRNKSIAPEPERSQVQWRDFLWLIPALLLGFLVYLNGLNGEFVYDDQLQISRNTLIQEPSQLWRALTSDVWRFLTGDQTNSNYWRPSFVLWLISNFRCFGFALLGWHLANVSLHLVVIAVAFVLLRRLAMTAPIAGAIVLIFAVHPVHCESVTWLSGAPDLILAAALLGSLYFIYLLSQKQTLLRWCCSLGLYVIGLGAKEMALLFPFLVIVLVYQNRADLSKGTSLWKHVFSITWPFVGLAIVYFVVRRSILGATQHFPEGGASLTEAILTAPAAFTFYIRQMVLPVWIGPSYPLRAVNAANIGMWNFGMPIVVSAIVIFWMVWMAKKSKIARIGLAVFLVPLLPVLNIVVLVPKQLVHDRYLYLPLLGFLMILVPAALWLLERMGGERVIRASLLIFIIAAAASIPLGAQTIRYNQAWTSN